MFRGWPEASEAEGFREWIEQAVCIALVTHGFALGSAVDPYKLRGAQRPEAHTDLKRRAKQGRRTKRNQKRKADTKCTTRRNDSHEAKQKTVEVAYCAANEWKRERNAHGA